MSGQMTTHFTVRKERGVVDSRLLVAADEAAPIFYLRKDTPPILLILGDNDWPARLEENQYFAAALKKVCHNEQVSLVVVPDRDHGTIVAKCLEAGDPAGKAMLELMKK
jgi:pimeloyl-ACP methyl ester carboxylesterase